MTPWGPGCPGRPLLSQVHWLHCREPQALSWAIMVLRKSFQEEQCPSLHNSGPPQKAYGCSHPRLLPTNDIAVRHSLQQACRGPLRSLLLACAPFPLLRGVYKALSSPVLKGRTGLSL